MKTTPVVFAVGKTYQIMVLTDIESMMWVQIGEKSYYDDSNGVLCSAKMIHRMIVPMDVLNAAKCYTVFEEAIVERKPYFTETGSIRETTFSFHPVTGKNIRCYAIADAHNHIIEPVLAAKSYGEIDFLIFNGDVPNDSSRLENFFTIYEIAEKLTKGNIPVVFARGNHELRGKYAEMLINYTPHENGKSYYTFSLGPIWGIVLDCGEDKKDDHAEYGRTICCHAFRERETEFLKNVVEKCKEEYLSEDICRRIVVVHNPFTEQLGGDFSIEEDIYREWSDLLKKYVKPDVMICGHLHKLSVNMPGCQKDHLGQPCPVVVGSQIENDYYVGCGMEFSEAAIKIDFTDSNGKHVWREKI